MRLIFNPLKITEYFRIGGVMRVVYSVFKGSRIIKDGGHQMAKINLQ